MIAGISRGASKENYAVREQGEWRGTRKAKSNSAIDADASSAVGVIDEYQFTSIRMGLF